MTSTSFSGTSGLEHNVAWLNEWHLPYEGAMTILLKYGWANCMSGKEICRTVFRRQLINSYNSVRHSRTLLEPHWVREDVAVGEGASFLRRAVVVCGLDQYAGHWARMIASDAHFRYCRSCLSRGYQSALFQIDALAQCPIHNEPLLNKCASCGTNTFRYAIVEDGFAAPFHCPSCFAPYSGSFEPSGWTAPELHKLARYALDPIVQWLQRLDRSGLNWQLWDDWFGPQRSESQDRERRIATFNVLTRVIPLIIDNGLVSHPKRPLQIFPGLLKSSQGDCGQHLKGDIYLTSQEVSDRVAIYKAIRRYAIRRIGGCYRVRVDRCCEAVSMSWGDQILQLSVKKCIRAQVLALWRARFEDTAVAQNSGLKLRASALNWPWNGCANSAVWAGYVLTSLSASAEVFNLWWQRASQLPDGELRGEGRVRAMELYTEFAWLLCPSRLPVLPSITLISSSATNDDGDQHALLIGPHSCVTWEAVLPQCPAELKCFECEKGHEIVPAIASPVEESCVANRFCEVIHSQLADAKNWQQDV